MVVWLISPIEGTTFKPSIAEVTVIGGVIIPSANKAAPPIIAGITNHFRRRRTRANKANIPPSPRLSALSTSITYLIVVSRVIVQMINESVPNIRVSLIVRSFIMELKTYKGEVPISPYIIPKATNRPAAVTLLTLFDTTFDF